jgi:hypothetical protein
VLEQAGFAIGDEVLAPGELAELASLWLAEDDDTSSRRPDLERELAQIEVELSQCEQAIHGLTALDADLGDRRRRREARWEEAKASVAAAEARLARGAEAEAEVEARHAALEAASDAERAAAEAMAEAEAEWQRAADGEHQAASEVAAAEAGLAEAEEGERRASAELEAAEAAGEAPGEPPHLDGEELVRRLDEAKAAAAAAEESLAAAEAALASIEQEEADRAPTDPEAESVVVLDPEAVEWYLLARLAAQRSVSYAGSLPLVLDDPLAGLNADEVRQVLDRLERMAGSVQLVVVTEDHDVAQWATEVGPSRAAVVTSAG